jgi:hypothetical protein
LRRSNGICSQSQSIGVRQPFLLFYILILLACTDTNYFHPPNFSIWQVHLQRRQRRQRRMANDVVR